jgi:hypothetical protein
MRWAFLAVAVAGVIAVGAVAAALFQHNSEVQKENCLAEVALEYPAPQALTPERNPYGGGIGGGPEEAEPGEVRAEEELLSERREEAVEAC